MIMKLEHWAAQLIPYRKWMLIAFVLTNLVFLPASVGMMIYFRSPTFILFGTFVSSLGFTWSWGLYLVSYWYNPDGGLLTLEKIRNNHPIFKWHAYILRYGIPVFLVIWFSSPFVLLMIFFEFMNIVMGK
jgi:hypothetical protein